MSTARTPGCGLSRSWPTTSRWRRTPISPRRGLNCFVVPATGRRPWRRTRRRWRSPATRSRRISWYGGSAEAPEDLVVEAAVGGDRVRAVRAGGAVDGGELAAGLV